MGKINFKTKIFKIEDYLIVAVPKKESDKLPSRGMALVQGTVNSIPFKYPLEPDGRGAHWFNINEVIQKKIFKENDVVEVDAQTSNEWPEPKIPTDLKEALEKDDKANTLWESVTPMARWDWIRWIRATKNIDTRKKHIVVAFSKLKNGTRRPCCFNRSMCTETSVSKNGILLGPSSN